MQQEDHLLLKHRKDNKLYNPFEMKESRRSNFRQTPAITSCQMMSDDFFLTCCLELNDWSCWANCCCWGEGNTLSGSMTVSVTTQTTREFEHLIWCSWSEQPVVSLFHLFYRLSFDEVSPVLSCPKNTEKYIFPLHVTCYWFLPSNLTDLGWRSLSLFLTLLTGYFCLEWLMMTRCIAIKVLNQYIKVHVCIFLFKHDPLSFTGQLNFDCVDHWVMQRLTGIGRCWGERMKPPDPWLLSSESKAIVSWEGGWDWKEGRRDK